MYSRNCDSPQPSRAVAGQRGRRPRAAVIAAAGVVLTALCATGCSVHQSPSASAGKAQSPSASADTAQPPLKWSAARAPLPVDADLSQDAAIDDVYCPAADDCVAVGYYTAGGASGDVAQGLVETLSGGTWSPAAFPGVSSKKGVAMLDAVSCPATGACVVVGDAVNGATVPVIETLSDGRWHSGAPALPSDAELDGSAFLNDISCPAAGTCVATGWYTDLNGYREGLLDMLSGGTWTAASAPLPGNAASDKAPSQADTFLADVACTGGGACVATGQYRDSDGGTQGVIDTLTGGTWKASEASLPADAAVSDQLAAVWAISCPAPGTCLAGGHYENSGGQPRYLIETLTNGTWTASTRPLPADAAANQEWSEKQSTSVEGIGCQSVSYCVMPVSYVASDSAAVSKIETLSGRTWTVSGEPLPSDAIAGSKQGGYLSLVSCPTPDSCLTTGAYTAEDGSMQGLIVTGTLQHG
jgi:hypothetical protein